ncbi:Fe-S cluster assembly ATPase SufC [Candidatus Woesearchaeota archaeon]|nr:Fe-S cluster assembly ATPase SufC [Candidatus Woesearchaeota archaeon]MBT5740369.1 Fe-S cluster assembly ATPase SufC [Candidatus Woesearchaeota archaeon]
MKLEIKDLHVEVEGKEILKGISLTIEQGKVHALMGPNGSGKSTLANVLLGHPKYTVTQGKIILNGEDITNLPPNERASKGLFLSFQYPKEISGVTLTNFLRAAYNATHKPLSIVDFYKLLQEKMAQLHVDKRFAQRYLNEGFSGGEKKKAEILQMLVLQPTFAILDETDSGLDVDALKIVAEGINTVTCKDRGILLITHYNRILEYITPDIVSILQDGKITKTGGKELAQQIEQKGFKEL